MLTTVEIGLALRHAKPLTTLGTSTHTYAAMMAEWRAMVHVIADALEDKGYDTLPLYDIVQYE